MCVIVYFDTANFDRPLEWYYLNVTKCTIINEGNVSSILLLYHVLFFLDRS